MKVKMENRSHEDMAFILRTLAIRVGVVACVGNPEGRYLRFTLKLTTAKRWQRRGLAIDGTLGRRVNAVCYHGHLAFMRELFAEYPGTVLVTTYARYAGRLSFEQTFRASGERTFGMNRTYGEMCDCEGS